MPSPWSSAARVAVRGGWLSLMAGLSIGAPAAGQEAVLVGDYTGSRIVRYEFPSGTPLSHFVGTGLTTMPNNTSMAFGPDGNLYIACDGNSSVVRVNGQTGQPIGTFVTPGAGGLSRPFGLAFGPDGRLYVSSRSSNSVLVYNGFTGAFVGVFVTAGSGSLSLPEGIAFGPSGDLFVASSGNDKVLRYAGATGAFVGETLAAGQLGINEPRGVLFDGGGRLYVASRLSSSIVVVDPSAGASLLASSASIPALSQPGLMALASTGELLVTCLNGTVQRVNRLTGASGGTLVTAGSGGVTGTIFGIAFLPEEPGPCYANCDGSTVFPQLNAFDFSCFLQRYRQGCP